MTNREFYVAVSSLENVPAELTEKANELIAKLDASNAKRISADSKQKKETSARRAVVLEYLSTNEGAHSRDEIALATELSPNQISSACSALIKEGLVAKSEIKIDKKVKVVYSIA